MSRSFFFSFCVFVLFFAFFFFFFFVLFVVVFFNSFMYFVVAEYFPIKSIVCTTNFTSGNRKTDRANFRRTNFSLLTLG